MRRITLLLLCFAALFSLCACDLKNRTPSAEFVPSSQAVQTEPPGSEPPSAEPSTEAAEALVIRDAFVKSGSYIDGYGIRYEYSYRLPYFDAGTAFAAGCNETVERQFLKPLEAELSAMENREPLSILTADYDTRLRGTVLTLYLTMTPVQGEPVYSVFTVDSSTADKAPGTALLQIAGLTEDRFLELTEQAIRDAFEKEYGAQTDDLRYTGALDRTLAEGSFGLEMPMYLDENDRLTVVATIYDLAGNTHLAPLTLPAA